MSKLNNSSVTDHVCHMVPTPVMLIRPRSVQRTDGKERLINRILIPLDGSELSKLVLPVGEELASKLKVSTTLFQIANMIRLYDDGMGAGAYIDYTKLNEDEKKRVSAEMIALEKELKEKGLNITHIVTSGFDAANEIIEATKKVEADLIVISTHGRSGLRRWVLGSVAEKVLRHGEIPILLVNARLSYYVRSNFTHHQRTAELRYELGDAFRQKDVALSLARAFYGGKCH